MSDQTPTKFDDAVQTLRDFLETKLFLVDKETRAAIETVVNAAPIIKRGVEYAFSEIEWQFFNFATPEEEKFKQDLHDLFGLGEDDDD